MPDSEKKRVSLMGPPRVTAWVRHKDCPPTEKMQQISEDAGAMELLALLLLSRKFLTSPDAKAGGEVRRDWLLAKITPRPDETPKQRRDNLVYRLGKLDDRLKISAYKGKREPIVFKMKTDDIAIDVLELVEAAKHLHVPENQEKVIALAGRPLLEGRAYPWMQEAWFAEIRNTLDTAYLTALHRRADSVVVQMEQANAQGKLAEAADCRSKALPLLDQAAERIGGEASHPFAQMFSDLRARASCPLPAAPQTGTAPGRPLPRPLTSFVGRDAEKAKIRALLTTQRLVTLTGMGGCGKTRLALAVAAEVQDTGGGDVRLVELASLTEPALAPQTVTKALGLEVRENFVDALIAYFQHKPTLLLLDNCEHLVQACAELVETLLQACPDLTVLATSREPLKIDGEHLCPVPPLGIPDPNHLPTNSPDPVAALLQHDSVRLFLDRIRPHGDIRLGPENIPAVAVICASLDGIPLALELAAARVKLLPLPAIAEMLTDRFGLLTDGRRTALPRHKTLRAVLDWSYDLLTGPEQALLCRLSVFAGGWTLDAAEAVGLAEGVSSRPVLDLLTSLVDKSLVTADVTAAPGRYGMLETVRHYAQDRLREMGEWDETRRKHREFYYQFAREANPQIHGPNQSLWLAKLETEHDNLRAALIFYQEIPDADEDWLRMAAALWWFWWVRGYLAEGRSHLALALSHAKEFSSDARSRALEGAGVLAIFQGEYQIAKAQCEEVLALCQELESKPGMASALVNLGMIAEHQCRYQEASELLAKALLLQRDLGDKEQTAGILEDIGVIQENQYQYQDAEANYKESLTLRQEIGDKRGIANSLRRLGKMSCIQGDYEQAELLFEESLALQSQLESKRGIAGLWVDLGELAYVQSQYAIAHKKIVDGLMLFQEIGEQWGTADVSYHLALIARDENQLEEAKRLFEESLTLLREMGDKQYVTMILIRLGGVANRQNRWVEASCLLHEALLLASNLNDELCIAHSFEELAVYSMIGQYLDKVGCLLGAAETIIRRIGYCRPPSEKKWYSETISHAREALSEEAFAAAWAEGQAMTWEQAVAFALEEPAPEFPDVMHSPP